MSHCLAPKIEHMVYLALSMSPILSAISHSPDHFKANPRRFLNSFEIQNFVISEFPILL